jgi:hypothetical protein
MKSRTSVAIDIEVLQKARALARSRGVSLSRLVSDELERAIARRRERGTRFPATVVCSSGQPGLPLARDHDKYAFLETEEKRRSGRKKTG